MKYFLDAWSGLLRRKALRRAVESTLVVLVVFTCGWSALEWKNVEANSAIEAALYKWMPVGTGKVLGPRPPKEAVPLLSALIQKQPTAELYSLRALNEEAALDFAAAEADWKKHAENSEDRVAGELALADFYHRRVRPTDEIAVLSVIGRAPATPKEKLATTAEQRSWQAFERIVTTIQENALPADVSVQNYRQWIARYPEQKQVYARYFQFLLDHKNFAEADKLIAQYRTKFADDEVFPVKARALLEYKKGSVEQGLAVYDTNFQPLWPQELVQSYFDLMTETRSLRKFLDRARASLEKNPDDLNAAARIYFYYQRQGRTDAAQQTLTDYRLRKEQRGGKWTSQELYSLARLEEGLRSYSEAARYYYALYNVNDRPDTQEIALAGLANILLEAPEQGIRLGSSELSMYKDVATLDPGPGFLNGILSLVLNTTSPQYQYSQEEQRAVPYFHRAEAAELLRIVDAKFPNTAQRPRLHARLLEVYSSYGESEAVIRDGQQFLTTFTNAAQREQVALLMVDAYARTNREDEEFKLYDSLLAELAKRADGIPLGAEEDRYRHASVQTSPEPENVTQADDSEGGDEEAEPRRSKPDDQRAFAIQNAPTQEKTSGVRSPEYSRVLERYLSRLVTMGRIPGALTVLRNEIDRNPNDPGLYERLAQFLEQNQLGQQQEQVYQRAIQQFPERSWYHKLARFYLRQKRGAEFEQLSQQVIKIFSGTELESYFQDVVGGREYYTRLNEYAHQRFPHDIYFTRNLLSAYHWDTDPRWEQLLREHWWEAEDLRNRYFEFLSANGRLEQELSALERAESAAQQGHWQHVAGANPVVARFVGEAAFWRSHFEQAAPVMGALAQQFPADAELGHRTSAVFRSLAAFNPKNTDVAVAIEENLYAADPGSRAELARIGDILSDRELFDRAAPYWDRMTRIRPGEAQAYLDPATVYWDYYNFDRAIELLNEGRTKLSSPALYSYESGAIYENKREYPAAVAEYVKGALEEHEGSRSYNRLLDLARRPKLRDVADQATVSIADGAAPDLDAVKLRLAVLETQNRPKDIQQLLLTIAGRTTSLELLEWLEETARQKSLVSVQQTVLERQAAVTTDPIRRLEIRYSLVRFYEGRKDFDAAQRNLESLYRENPKILGVVRATVDFYWRNKEQQQAIDVLLQAAKDAYPDLRKQFLYEAARKETDAAQYEPARKLLQQLLADSPYNDEYLGAIADTFARAGDDQGLKTFYLQKIEEFRKAPLQQDVKTREIAGLQRGLIPALTRLKDHSGAVDQYIEIINKFADDDALISEAALYAQKYGRDKQLVDYYANTIKQSPRDYRWPMVLAKVQTQLEQYPAAIDTYALAIRVRPDRVDLRTARAELLERTMQFDEAAADYQRLFDLNYHDTRWMEKLAEVRARQGKAQEAVAALQAALIDGRPEKPANYFEAARRLESWGMLKEAREFAQKGIDSAGRDLLAVSDNRPGAELYARVMTRLRQQDAAYQRLKTAEADATSFSSAVNVAVKQVEKQGIAAITDQQWRDRELSIRRTTAGSVMSSAMKSMGGAVGRYFTPEEKIAFASWLEGKAANSDNDDLAAYFVAAAAEAGLADVEARWNDRLMMAHAGGGRGHAYKSRLVTLQTRRLRFADLGAQLERYANTLNQEQGRDGVLMEAAHAYRQGAEYDKELQVLALVEQRIGGEQQQRYFELLLRKHPEKLVQLAGDGPDWLAVAATQYTVTHGDAKLAQQAIAARGGKLDAVWTPAYTALSGLYHADRSPITRTAFISSLGDATIGERIGKPVDRTRQLAGNTWFYYGSRYGAWLGVTSSGDPEDFLPAILEQSPNTSAGYVTTAEYYASAGKLDRALVDYRHTLELAPGRADIHDRIALLYWRQQKRTEAITEWKQALEMFDAQVNRRSVPSTFWSDFGYTMNHIGNRHVLDELRPQADTVLRDYVRHNGTYAVQDILRAAYRATGDPQAGTAWVLELAAVAPDKSSFLGELVNASWIADNAREPLYQSYLATLQDRSRTTDGLAKQYAEQDLRTWQVRYAEFLVKMKRFDRAAAVLDALPKENQSDEKELEVRIRIAVERQQLDAMIEQYRQAPENAPNSDALRAAAQSLRKDGQHVAARKILEYVFGQEIAEHRLSATNMLGLAEIRLQDGDTAGALQLLRRLTLVVGQPFENLEPAASLLSRTGHHAEAVEFLAQLLKARPWDAGVRLRLAQEQLAAGSGADQARNEAASVAKDPQAAYTDRAEGASILKGHGVSGLGSAELDLLASDNITADAAYKQYFYAVRMSAAVKSPLEVRERLLRNALNDSPERDAARIPLFTTLNSEGKDQLAISAIEPTLSNGFLRNATPEAPVQDQSGETEDNADSTPGDELNVAPPSEAALENATSAQRAALAYAVGKSYLRLEQYQFALRYLQTARVMETSRVTRAEIDKSIVNVRATIRRMANNERRVPQIHNELEQERTVHPRLVAAVARSAPLKSPATAPKGGSAQ